LTNRWERRAAEKSAKQGRMARHLVSPEEAAAPNHVSALLARATELYRGGKLAEAERAYRTILSRAPRNPDALHQFGILAGQSGRFAEAEGCVREAIALRPGEPAFHRGLGLLSANQGRFEEALACYEKALALHPEYIGALLGRADALHELGRLADSEAAYRKASRLAPHAPEIRFGWATVLADLGRLEEAARAYRELLALSPNFAEAHVNLGTVLRDLGRLNEAAAAFQTALTLKPEIAYALVELVSALSALGRSAEAVDRATEAMRRDPGSSEASRAFAIAVARSGPLDYSAEIAAGLARCLSASGVDYDDLAKVCGRQLRQRHRIDPSPKEAARRAVEAVTAEERIPECLADPLLLRLLSMTINTDLELEAFLTEVRRRLALAQELPTGLDPFLAALALQCFNNGYVFAVDAEEDAWLAELRSELEAALSPGTMLDPALEQKLLRFALYEPITALTQVAQLLGASIAPSAPLNTVLARCLAEPLQEAELVREIPSLGTIGNRVSRAVRDQYEEHPYPRWLSLPQLTPVSLPAMLRRKFPHVALPGYLDGPVEVLVAGCGTGRQPIATALSVAGTEVLAVDLSLKSLGYARRMALRFGASNLSFLHADLLALGALGRDFAMVEAVGVLHHMEDPIAGWRVLCGLLRAGGFMRIGLYSELARADVVAARGRIAGLGLAPRVRDIRAFRQSILFGDESERLPALALSKDIYDLNGCRDLLFHAREHRYTIPEIGEMLRALGLEFLGFDLPDDRVVRAYRAENPGDPAANDLARWARFEAVHPNTFSGMYVFWCRKA
jgi:tetratricopeptide (TPR) repeat protein/SAM-dependent methyltransferase